MTATLRIDSLHIEAFRGITATIDLDLRSPITLLYAANGTGKTTLCEAAEWLITGQVDRLRTTQHFNQDVLVSKFATNGKTPQVMARLHVGSQDLYLARDFEGARCGSTAADAAQIQQNDLLARLAPSAATEDTHHLTAINLRQSWLRGTRFLSSEALATLVDSNEQTIERRKQIFADLLGIRHLLDAEKSLGRYCNLIAPERREIERVLEAKTADGARLRASLNLGQAVGSSALLELRAAQQSLRMRLVDRDDSDKSEFPDSLERVAAELGRQRQTNLLRVEALRLVDRDWTDREQLIRAIQEDENAADANAEQLGILEAELQRVVETLTVAVQQEAVAEQIRRRLVEAQDEFGPKLAKLAEVVSLYAELIGRPFQSVTFGELHELLPEAAWTAEARETRQSAVRVSTVQQPQILADQRRVESLELNLKALRRALPAPAEIDSLEESVQEAEQTLLRARKRREEATEPLMRLHALSSELLGSLRDQTECPLCGHDWQDTAALRRAIQAVLAAGPPGVIGSAEAEVHAASINLEAARTRRDEVKRTLSEVRYHETEIASLTSSISRFLDALRSLGIDKPLDDCARQLTIADRRLDLANIFSDLSDEEARRVEITGPLFLSELVVTSAPERISAELAKRFADATRQIDTLRHGTAEQTKRREALEQSTLSHRNNLAEARDRLSRNGSRLDAFRTAWSLISEEKTWTEDALERAKARSATEADRLNGAEEHLSGAREAYLYETRQAQLKSIENEIASLRSRRQYLLNRTSAAERGMSSFREQYTRLSREQVEGLSRVVNPLFGRMHANRIFDGIKLGDDEDFLRWVAGAGEQFFNPEIDFGQGQRQDLALSLFLARALSIGGTFFLDEPVLRLDELNRVGLLDTFRVISIQSEGRLNLLITTASKTLARHMIEKFDRIGTTETAGGPMPPLRVVELRGNGRIGLERRTVYPASSVD